MLHPFPLCRFIWIVVAGILTGALYAGVQYGTPMPGAVAGGSITATLFALERFVLRRNAGGLLEADPPLQRVTLPTRDTTPVRRGSRASAGRAAANRHARA